MSAAKGIFIVAPVFGESPLSGHWLRAYDPDSHGGHGHIIGTPDPAEALRFATGADALACWRQQSRARPLRPDGKPNRPLTAFTVEICDLPEEP